MNRGDELDASTERLEAQYPDTYYSSGRSALGSNDKWGVCRVRPKEFRSARF